MKGKTKEWISGSDEVMPKDSDGNNCRNLKLPNVPSTICEFQGDLLDGAHFRGSIMRLTE
jgi:hypothetical protein